jgi:Zn finger protein HypA/HybF involved in hydrogenase expression
MAKERVEDCTVLDVLEFAREGHLVEGSRGERWWSGPGMGSTTLFFHAEDDYLYLDRIERGTMVNQRHWPVELTHTRTSFGAERVWFYCPLCGRVVRKLYLPPGCFDFRCRSCHSLTYASQQTRAWGGWKKMAFHDRLALRGLLTERSRREDAGLDLSFDPFLDGILTGRGEKTASGPRPRGRPKEKRSYQRRTPFLSGERPSERHGLCMRCRDYRELAEPQAVTLANGRSARKGTCPTCGATMILIVKG